jgi:hypothetical protein
MNRATNLSVNLIESIKFFESLRVDEILEIISIKAKLSNEMITAASLVLNEKCPKMELCRMS